MHGKIYIADALELDHPLNRGLAEEWACLPGQQRGSVFRGLRKKNDAAIVGDATWASDELRRGGYGAILLDGSGDSLNVGTKSALSTNDQTLSAWVWFVDVAAAGDQHILEHGSFPSTNWYFLSKPNLVPKITYFFSWGGSSFFIDSTSILVSQKWTHVVATYKTSTTTAAIYIDGKPNALTTSGDPPTASNEPFRIGSASGGGGSHLNGMIGDVSVRNISYSPSEVAQLHEEQLRGNPNRWKWYKRKTYSIPAAASFQVAWARNCNTYIGAGRA